MSYNQNKSIEIRIDGNRVANVESLDIECTREIIEENGVPSANLKETKIVFKRAICINSSISDSVTLKALKKFTMDVCVPGLITTYTDCLCVGYRETIGEGNKIIEELTAIASSYKQIST